MATIIYPLRSWTVLVIVLCATSLTHSYNILGIFPTKASSHFRLGWTLMQGLADAGHNVTLICPYDRPTYDSNLTAATNPIRIVHVGDKLFFTTTNHLGGKKDSPFTTANQLMSQSIASTRNTLQSISVQALMKSTTDHFDVIVMESFLNEAMLGFGVHFKAPVIAFSPFGATKLTHDMVGSPAPSAYVPHVTLALTDRMTFAERMLNTLTLVGESLFINLVYLPAHTKLLNEFFGPDVPALSALQTNVSLVLLYTHFTINYPRPYMINMIEVGGMHIHEPSGHQQLPARLERFLDDATEHGVIYFSMGSIIKSSGIPAAKLHALRRAFGSLRQRVLWKWDADDTADNEWPPNVMIGQWFPQDAVLAHPNVRAFITHGGLLSTMEAVYFGVPIIGMPIYGDQHLNVAKAVAAGYGLLLRFDNVTEHSLRWALDEVIGNEKYRNHMQLMSRQFRDQPRRPLETAIYWIEYVARYQGAPQLQSAGRLLSCWAACNVDVYAVFALVLVAVTMLVQRMVRFVWAQFSRKVVKLKRN